MTSAGGNKQDQTQYRYFLPMDRELAAELDKALSYGQRRPMFTTLVNFCLDLNQDDRSTFQALADGRISVVEAVQRLIETRRKRAEAMVPDDLVEPPDEPTSKPT